MLTKSNLFKFLVHFSFFCFLSIVCTEARVYKCVDKDGKILFSNTLCPEDTKEQSFKLKESYTINDEINDKIRPDVVTDVAGDNETTNESFKSDVLEINIAQEKITLHPAEISRIHQGISFVSDYFKNVYQISPNSYVNLKIFGKHGDFMSYQHRLIGKTYSESGIFLPRTGEALVNGSKYRNRVVAISIHEASHALIQPAGYRIPSWVNEGIAEYFETIEISETQVLFKPQDDRHSEIAQLFKEKKLTSLLEYFGLSNKVWKNRNLVEDRTSRSIAWSLVHFLMSSKQGTETIMKIMNNFKIDDESPSMYIVNNSYPGGLNVLEQRWHEYLKSTPSAHAFNKN